MITIVAKVDLKEGKKEDFKKAAQPLIDGSQGEAGNVSYDLYEDIENDNVVAFIEVWKNAAAIDSHNETDHFKEGVKAIGPFMENMVITKYSK